MGLFVPVASQNVWENNLAATPSTTGGTTITASASANTKGAYATLIASTAFDVKGITLVPNSNATSAAVRNMLIDIAVGAAGSEIVVASNIMLQQSNGFPNTTPVLFLPIRFPKGSRISARCQSSTGSSTVKLTIFTHGGGDGDAWSSFEGVETIGAATATSKGQAHTFGSTGTFSSWANLGSTSSRQFNAIQPIVQQGSDTTMDADLGYLEIGINSVAFGRWVVHYNIVEATGLVYPIVPLYKRFPSGTQFMLRGTDNVAANADVGVGLLGYF